MEIDYERVNWVEVAQDPVQYYSFVLVTSNIRLYYPIGSFPVCPMFCNKCMATQAFVGCMIWKVLFAIHHLNFVFHH